MLECEIQKKSRPEVGSERGERLCFGCLVLNSCSRDSVHPAALKVVDLRGIDDHGELVPIIILISAHTDLLSETLLLKLLKAPENVLTGSFDMGIDRRSSGSERAGGRLNGEELGLLTGGRCEELGELGENSDTTGLGGFASGGFGSLISEDDFSDIREGEVAFESERDHLSGGEFCDL
jgi:hypothetical protein